MNTILHGILLGLSITAPIGPTNIEIIRRGLKEGWKSAFMFCMGVIIALIIYLVLVVFGLSFLTEFEIFNKVLLSFGVIVLFYLAFCAIKDFFQNKELVFSGELNSKKHFIQGIILTLSNPAVLLLWSGIMGADLASNRGSFKDGLILSIGILIGVLFFFICLTVLIYGGKRFINKNNFKYISLAAGLILLYFGFKFGYELIMKFI
jgi:threonine/homoserine/homoserine lactone efflux protein